MAVLLAGVGPGDEVICPPFTFVSSVNAFVLRGARAAFRRHPVRHPQPRRAARRGGDHAAHPGVHAGALRRRRLRDRRAGRHRPPSRPGADRGQRPRVVRPDPRPAARQRRRDLDAQLPRDQEPHLRRGRGAGHQRPGAGRSGRGAAREGHQPQPVLSRAGRQVHVGRRRLQLPAVGNPRRLPVGADRGARRDPGAAPRHLAALRRGTGRVGGADGRRHADRAAALRAPGAPLLPAAAVARGPAGPDRAPARPADPGGVPLPAAAPLRPGGDSSAAGPDSFRSPKRSPIGWCGCRCTTT